MENLRVRRAGFAYRRLYEVFLARYKSLCSHTWPNYSGSARNGVELICQQLSYQPDDYRLGRTKLFIRFPRVLFSTEDALQSRKQELATLIQARYRCYHQRCRFLKMKHAAVKMESVVRMFIAKKLLERRRRAAQTIRRYIKGFMTRDGPPTEDNQRFIRYMKFNFLMTLKEHLPGSILDKSWPRAPRSLQQTSTLLHKLFIQNLARRYRLALTPDRKHQLTLKVLAESLFLNKKQSYRGTIPQPFINNRLDGVHSSHRDNVFAKKLNIATEHILYSCLVTKYDRHGYTARQRILIVTSAAVYILNDKDFKLKQKIPFCNLTNVSVSSLSDGVFVLHTDTETSSGKHTKTDWIYVAEHVIELLVYLCTVYDKSKLVFADNNTIACNVTTNKQVHIDFGTGPTTSQVVKRASRQRLSVIVPNA
jgi:myosin-1